MNAFVRQPAIWKRLQMPNGDKIIVAGEYADDGSELSLHDINHNVYRLTPKGTVVWQVQRDDSIMPPGWWEAMHRIAREQGLDGMRKPFSYLVLEYPDGTRTTSDEQGDGIGIAQWQPSCIIHLYGSGNDYVLDPDTGIATNVETGPGRPW